MFETIGHITMAKESTGDLSRLHQPSGGRPPFGDGSESAGVGYAAGRWGGAGTATPCLRRDRTPSRIAKSTNYLAELSRGVSSSWQAGRPPR